MTILLSTTLARLMQWLILLVGKPQGLDLEVRLSLDYSGASLTSFHVKPVLIDQVREAQGYDLKLKKIKSDIEQSLRMDFFVRSDEALLLGTRLCVVAQDKLKKEILDEAYSLAYAMHPQSTKIYRMFRELYWWLGIKKEIVEYMT